MERHLHILTSGSLTAGTRTGSPTWSCTSAAAGAATACDTCIYLALRKGMEGLYPYDAHRLTQQDYKAFSMKMKPYLKPRRGGIDRLETYMEGFGSYPAGSRK